MQWDWEIEGRDWRVETGKGKEGRGSWEGEERIRKAVTKRRVSSSV